MRTRPSCPDPRRHLLSAATAQEMSVAAPRLADVERAATTCNEHIAHQRTLIRELQERGDDTTAAEALLATLIQSQVLHQRHCFRLRMELVLAKQKEIASTGEV
jgi:hypothetical protein